MSHVHKREDDETTPAERLDGVYKVGKILAMVFIVGGFFLSIRDQIAEIPKIHQRVTIVERESIEMKQQLSYLVGGMETLTRRKFRPNERRRTEGDE